jgi:hypothetical protein
MRLRGTRLLGILPALCWAFSTSVQADDAKPVDFAHDITPILKARCIECHSNGTYKGAFSLETRATILKAKAVVPGNSGDSELFKRITHADAEMRMPPKGKPLTAKEIDLVRAWIDQGLKWDDGFTFKKSAYVAPLKPRRPKLPAASDGRSHPIDRIVDAYLARNNVPRPQAADDIAFVRRIYLDLIGQLPGPSEIEAFFKDDRPDKRDRLARALLADKRAFADHWLSFWNDMLRNDYVGTGYVDGGRKQITAWLYRSLAENKHYDQFTRELIAPTPDAEGFAKGIKWRGNVNASQVAELQFAQNVGQVFFGINLKCASCHDSFIDSWKLDDAYSLAAVIADKPLQMHRCDKPLEKFATARFLFPELGGIDAAAAKTQRLEQLAALVTHKDNGRFPRTIANRLWQRLMGHGLVHPVDAMGTAPPWSVDLLDYLAVYLSDHDFDLKQLLEHIATSKAYQARMTPIAQEPLGDYVYRGQEVKRMTAEQFIDAVWQLTGAGPKKPAAAMTTGPKKPAEVMTALPEFDAAAPPERRLIRAALVNSDSLMRSLGRPNREQVVTSRPDQLTTLQALDLSNGQALSNLLAAGAVRLRQTLPKATPDEFVERVFQQLLCRKPTPAELTVARDIVGKEATAESLADFMWTVLMLPEFALIR